MAIRRLFFDIETSFNIIGDFACGYNKVIGHNQILEERKIICICYKWEGKPKVYHLAWDKNKCDKAMIRDFLKVLNQAEEIIAHNGDKFDIRWLRGRCFIHELDMMPEYNTVDTLKKSRSLFNFNSNRLDYLSKITGGGGKLKTDWDMWVKITLYNHKPSLIKMIKYCKVDVTELERVYHRMLPYLKAKTTLDRDYLCNCPNCNSSSIGIEGYRVLMSGSKVIKLRCKECVTYFSMPLSKFNIERKKMTE
jgi:DNA polymerase elongation subunit (family B)